MIKQASKKNYEKFYKLLSKQELRVLQAFKEKKNKASKYKSKQAKKSFETFKASKAKKSLWKIIVKESFTFLRDFPKKRNLL